MIERSDLSTGEASPQRNPSVRLALRLHRIKLVARRYWWIVALTMMIGLGIQDYRCYTEPPRYFSFSRMMAGGRVAVPSGQLYNENIDNFYGTQVALMKSPETCMQAVDRVSTLYPDVTVDNSATIEATLEPRTAIFNLKVTSTSPEYAKLLLDAVMDTFLATKRDRRDRSTEQASSAITEEISHLDAEIRNDEQQLLDFQKQNNVVFIKEQSASTATYLVELNNELATLIKEHGLLTLESSDPLINPGDYAAPSKTGDTNIAPGSSTLSNSFTRDSSAILAEQDYIEKLKILRDEYGVYLKDLHPKMQNLTDAINKEEKFLDTLKKRNVNTRDARREDLELQIKNLQKQIDVWNTKSLELSDRLGTYEQLEDKITRERTLYSQLSSSIQAVTMNKDLDQDSVEILESASKAKPIDPNHPLQMAYGLALGLLAGVGLIYLVNRLDDKIDSPLEVEENIEFPVVGQIPLVPVDPQSHRVPLLRSNDQRHEFLEHHRYVRSALLFQSSDKAKPRSLLICSAAPGEGKSTIAANLSAVFAHSGSRTLLIDGDLRKGVQHTLFDLPIGPGLSNFLLGEIAWHEIIYKTNVPNLDVITRGKVPQRAGDLFLVPELDQLLQESLASYDIVIWDSAPLLAANDAANFCSKVEGVLFVARVRHSTISSVRTALDDLSQRNANIFGIVLNAVEPSQPGYYDKYRYKEYYGTPVEA